MNATHKFNSEQERAKILDRIRKILAVAKGTSFQAEADTAMRMALNYMKKYGLSMSEVELQKDLEEPIVQEDLNRGVKTQEVWERHMCVAVAEVFDCSTFFHQTRDYSSMTFCGYKKDVEMCIVLFNVLLVSAKSAANSLFKGDMKCVRDFLFGFGLGLRDRVHKEKEAMKKDAAASTTTSCSYALVVVEKSKKVAAWVKEKNSNLKSKHHQRRSDIDEFAFMAGHAHANKVDLLNKEKIGATK